MTWFLPRKEDAAIAAIKALGVLFYGSVLSWAATIVIFAARIIVPAYIVPTVAFHVAIPVVTNWVLMKLINTITRQMGDPDIETAVTQSRENYRNFCNEHKDELWEAKRLIENKYDFAKPQGQAHAPLSADEEQTLDTAQELIRQKDALFTQYQDNLQRQTGVETTELLGGVRATCYMAAALGITAMVRPAMLFRPVAHLIAAAGALVGVQMQDEINNRAQSQIPAQQHRSSPQANPT